MKNKLEKLKGFPLSLEQKERLLELIEDKDDKKLIIKYIKGSDNILISDKNYKVEVNGDDFEIYDKELYKHLLDNDVTKATLYIDAIGGEEDENYKGHFIMDNCAYVHDDNSIRPDLIAFAFSDVFNTYLIGIINENKV